MSTVTEVSNVIGDHMLKGWVLTDSPCPHCKHIPLMRSPKNQTPIVHFCANCDGDPRKVTQPSSSTSSISDSSISHQNTISRFSTPATELSDMPGSPTFTIPAETPESRRRREQSDRASSEIGNRLLKGWALLGEECLNVDCFGIPLVRPPKSGGEKDPRRECVICGRIYVGEGELVEAGLAHSPVQKPSIPAETVVADPSSSNVHTVIPHATESVNSAFERQKASRTMPLAATSLSNESTISALNVTTRALEQTLISLSGRLTASAVPPMLVDPQSISSIIDTISKTTQALAEVKKLRQNMRE
ncbi:hypothetical protein J3R30DRAFT_3719274 [Lentinula aciculospora]|uniref:Sjogrens syndrome scleroderma autoantigen 1 family protein n=1 Tax=Lentinula aciculospora TaxID=153920 RepID=A0A9W8ZUB0_9AGAR|nr:hypothetical protein J3R30DRAFT_3719274 [Lentinula aciculospora]